MTTPQNPEEEPVGDELPEQPAESVPDEDALWRAIVDNYGERPEIPVAEPEAPRAARDPGLPPPPDETTGGATATDPAELSREASGEDHYVPPPPPPLPTPPPARLLAWIGLFGVPMFVLLALVAHLAIPTLLSLVLMIWFVGGFVFLVASMRPGPGEDHDDGARL